MKRMMGLVVLGSWLAVTWPAVAGAKDTVIYKDRVLRVLEDVQYSGKNKAQPYYYLMKASTHFGLQFLKPKKAEDVGNPAKDLSLVPTCYHHQRSPVGIVMEALEENAAPL